MTENLPTSAADRPWEAMDSGVIRHAIDPTLLGHAEISPKGGFEAGSHVSFTLVYTAGKFGIDDSGSLRVVFQRGDFTAFQSERLSMLPLACRASPAISALTTHPSFHRPIRESGKYC